MVEVATASEASSFGKYTLVAKLATGGMAEIFLARLLSDGGFEKLVCIKRILPHLAKDPQFIAMFLDEARVVARISHPNVCQVFELGEIDGQYYIAMEYLAGVPLAAFRRTDFYPSPPDPRLVAAFGVQACEGLHHAHQLKRGDGSLLEVVHRDITPQNLFVTIDGIVKVLDFGIAKVQDQSLRTSTGALKGTYCYMSPEQLRGEPIDRRSDVWGLGTVLWETLAQRHLFKRETEFNTFQAITHEPIPDVCEIRPDVPPLLADTIARALSRNRDERFATARSLGEALAQAVGPLGGVSGAAAISDEVARAFEPMLREQRQLLEMAREGDTFDLDKSSPLGSHGVKLGTTPISNIRSKVAAAQAEVAHYVAMQEALEGLDEPSSSGFTPPPGGSRPYAVPKRRTSKPMPAQPARRSRPFAAQSQTYPVAPDEWTSGLQGAPESSGPPPRTMTIEVPVPASRLPWLIALIAVGIAGATGAALYMSRTQPPPAPVAANTVVEMHSDPAPAAAVVPADAAAVVVVEAARDATAPTVPDVPPPAQHPDKHLPPRPTPPKPTPPPPTPTGPPGFITIDSTPVYAVIFIDGKKYGETPLVHISIPPGKHTVRAVSASGSTRTLSIAIESGRTAPVRRVEW